MDPNEMNPLEQAVTALKHDEPAAAELQAATERVWQRLADPADLAAAGNVEMIRSCADVRALLPLYRSGTLPRARYLLVDDHLQECVACRHVAEARPDSDVEWRTAMPALAHWGAARYVAMAAMLVLVVGSVVGYRWFNAGPPGARAQVQSVQGTLYLVSANGMRSVGPGVEIAQDEIVRTAGGSRAFVRLTDGSIVEMNGHSELSVSATRRDTTVHLDRGAVIVQAAHRSSGHLYVTTPDARVAVTGTIFAVSSGLKGSRVAVVQGEVHVAFAGKDNILHPAMSVATNSALGTVPVRDEIAWSANFDQHLALLAQFATLQKKFEQIQAPAPRYTSHILPLVAADTMVYASLPNIGNMLAQANTILQQQVAQSPVLGTWWNDLQTNHAGPTPQEMINKVIELSQYLGDEVVFVATPDNTVDRMPAVLAEVKRAGLRQYLDAEAQRLAAAGRKAPQIYSADELAAAPDGNGAIFLVRDDMLVITGDVKTARFYNAQLNSGASGFAGTAFGQRLQQAYAKGAGFLFAADAEDIIAYEDRAQAAHRRAVAPNSPQHHSAVFQHSGFANLRYIVVEHREANGSTDNRAAFEFNGPRQSVASWLAAPAPIGSLEFISPDAAMANSIVSKNPAQMFDDVLALDDITEARQKLAELEAKLNLNLRDDLAASLGGDVTFALDGPMLPIPSWKLVVEVYDPGRFAAALQKIVEAAAREQTQSGQPAVTSSQETVDGQTFYTITPPLAPAVHYTFFNGYMIAAPNRALLVASMNTRRSGMSLAHSQSFRALLPADNRTDFSAVLYQNLTPVLAPLAEQLTAAQMQSLQQIAADSRPTVVTAYGDNDRVEIAATGRFFGLDLNTLTLGALLGRSANNNSGGVPGITPSRPPKKNNTL